MSLAVTELSCCPLSALLVGPRRQDQQQPERGVGVPAPADLAMINFSVLPVKPQARGTSVGELQEGAEETLANTSWTTCI